MRKRANAKMRGIPFLLSFDEYCLLLKQAGITTEQVGRQRFHLSRKQDKGAYCIGNCKFVYYKENLKERRTSENGRRASVRNITNFNLHNNISEEQRRLWCAKGGKNSGLGKRNRLKAEEVLLRLNKISAIDLSKYGWVQKVSDILCVCPASARKFVTNYYNGQVYTHTRRKRL